MFLNTKLKKHDLQIELEILHILIITSREPLFQNVYFYLQFFQFFLIRFRVDCTFIFNYQIKSMFTHIFV